MLTWILSVLGPKLFGVFLDKGMEALQLYLSRKDLEQKVRKDAEIAAVKLANRALEWKAAGIAVPDRVQPGSPDISVPPPPPNPPR